MLSAQQQNVWADGHRRCWTLSCLSPARPSSCNHVRTQNKQHRNVEALCSDSLAFRLRPWLCEVADVSGGTGWAASKGSSKSVSAPATRAGLLLNELQYSPEPVLDSVLQLLQFAYEQDPGRPGTGREGLILFLVRLAVRVESHAMLVLQRAGSSEPPKVNPAPPTPPSWMWSHDERGPWCIDWSRCTASGATKGQAPKPGGSDEAAECCAAQCRSGDDAPVGLSGQPGRV